MTTDNKDTGNKKPSSRHKFFKRLPKWVYILGTTGAIAGAGMFEWQTSYFQSKVFHHVAEGHTYSDTQCRVTPPATGPYDEQLGYTHTEKLREALRNHGFDVSCAPWQDRSLLGLHLFPIYNEKAQAGLTIKDAANQNMFEARFPRQAYANFDSIPPVLVNSLLFVENRELMADHPASWNPAIEWARFANAVLGQGLKKVGVHHDGGGGSTLATQIEKFRHSPDGVTGTPKEKLRQMITASVRAYMDSSSTVESRRQIVADYLNSMPLSSYPGVGAVNGYADGMNAWFGTGFNDANRILSQKESALDDAQLKEYAKVYRQSLSLVMAVKKPTDYLVKDRQELEDRIDKFLPTMAKAGIISNRLRDAVLAERVEYADAARPNKVAPPPSEKSVQGLQADLLRMLGVKGLYDLNRMDVTAQTTIDRDADAAVSKTLHSLNDPAVATAKGLTGFQLLNPAGAPDVIYSFTLYEKTADGRNVLRVQTDNFNGPLNLNEGTKLELGSTAKLRTLVAYLEAVQELRDKYMGQDPAALKAMQVPANDHITRWALDYLAAPDTDKSLSTMLEAALDRTYSGNPGETFFTGGGSKRFVNFENSENGKNFTVKDAFHHSVNLSFIRIMRDIVAYTESQKMHIDPAIYTDPDNPQRIKYLQQFADMEGRGFMWKFYGEQKGKSPAELAELLAARTHRSPVQLAVVYRSLFPDKPVADMESFIRKECKDCGDKTDFQALYDKYAIDKFDLNDRGYITSIHPLALWLAEYQLKNPDVTWDQAAEASTAVRQETYKWLFKDGKDHAQNLRIQTMLEKEAFTYIHDTWAKLGYPFATMVPSYASAIGVSGDTPAALATLAGIIQNDGVLKTSIKFTEIEMGRDTPYETKAQAKPVKATQVLPPEITTLVRREMQGVVAEGTAKRADHSMILSDGRVLPVGGKTGTGDNRMQTFGAHGGVKSSEAKSRTATFVFTIDDRFFGCVTAWVMGPEAGQYKFTSALAAQVFKTLGPDIQPVLDRAYGVPPGAKPPVPAAKQKKTAGIEAPKIS